MIVRLEPKGEAKSTAELYLSAKGTVFSQAKPFVLLFSFQLLQSLTQTFIFFTEIELAMVPTGESASFIKRLQSAGRCLEQLFE